MKRFYLTFALLKNLKINLLYPKKGRWPAFRFADLQKSARQFSHGLGISMCYTLSSKTLEDTKAQAVFYVDVKKENINYVGNSMSSFTSSPPEAGLNCLCKSFI